MKKVWIDWGDADSFDDVKVYKFSTKNEFYAFLDGVLAASEEWNIDDFRKYYSEEDARNAFKDDV